MSGKALEDCNPCWVLKASEKGVHLQLVGAEVEPVSPMSEPDFGSLVHDPVEGVSPSKMEQTSEVLLVLGRSSSHDCFCVRGKCELNMVRNWQSVRS